MDKLQRQVQEFHRDVLKQPFSPAEPMLRMQDLRAMLIAEEAIEAVCALVGGAKGQTIVHEMLVKVLNERTKKKLSGPSLVEAIDGCIDTLVVTYGTLEAIGVDGEPFADEVMRSNMDNKMGKPPGWRDADIAGVLAKMLAERQEPMRVEQYCRFCDEIDPGFKPCRVAGDGLHSVRQRKVPT